MSRLIAATAVAVDAVTTEADGAVHTQLLARLVLAQRYAHRGNYGQKQSPGS